MDLVDIVKSILPKALGTTIIVSLVYFIFLLVVSALRSKKKERNK